MSDKIGVALTKEICPVCCKQYDGDILFNTVLTESNAKKVEEPHGQPIGFMEHPCDECREKMPEGSGTWLIIIDEDKTDDTRNPFRNGQIVGIKKEAAEKVFNHPYSEVAFIDYRIAQQIGLEVQYTP